MGRPAKPEEEKARNAGMTLYPAEIDAIEAAAKATCMKTSADFVRDAVIRRDHPKTRGKIIPPRRIPKSTSDQSRAPRTLPQPPS